MINFVSFTLLVMLMLNCSIKQCWSAALPEQIDNFDNDLINKYIEIGPVDNSEEEFYIKYPLSADFEEQQSIDNDNNQQYLSIEDFLTAFDKRNNQKSRELLHKQRALWDIGFGKRFDLNSFTDSHMNDKRGRSKSFMDAIYGKRSSRTNKNKAAPFGRKSHWDLQFGK